MGTADQPRRSRTTSTPSRSGRPRSRMTRSGLRVPASIRPRSPVAASTTWQPSASSAVRTKRRICGSSSMTTTVGEAARGVSIRPPPGTTGRLARRQGDDEAGAALGAVLRPDRPLVRLDDGAHDGQAQADARPPADSSWPRVNFSNRLSSLPGGSPGPLSATVMVTRSPSCRAAISMRLPCRRVLRGVLQQVAEHPLHQHGVEFQQRQVRRQVDVHLVPRQRAGQGLQGGAHHFLQRLPFPLEPDMALLQARHVEQVAHQGAGAQGLVADRPGRSRPGPRAGAGRPAAGSRPGPPARSAACAGRGTGRTAGRCAAVPTPSAPGRPGPPRRNGPAPGPGRSGRPWSPAGAPVPAGTAAASGSAAGPARRGCAWAPSAAGSAWARLPGSRCPGRPAAGGRRPTGRWPGPGAGPCARATEWANAASPGHPAAGADLGLEQALQMAPGRLDDLLRHQGRRPAPCPVR